MSRLNNKYKVYLLKIFTLNKLCYHQIILCSQFLTAFITILSNILLISGLANWDNMKSFSFFLFLFHFFKIFTSKHFLITCHCLLTIFIKKIIKIYIYIIFHMRSYLNDETHFLFW